VFEDIGFELSSANQEAWKVSFGLQCALNYDSSANNIQSCMAARAGVGASPKNTFLESSI
jgi:hypothetical protein